MASRFNQAGSGVQGLLLSHLTDPHALETTELECVAQVYDRYIFRPRRKKRGGEWLTDKFIRKAHRDMFGAIWAWAGEYRQTPSRVGMEWSRIPEAVVHLCEDFKDWDSPGSAMPLMEIAARLYNRLTRIHPFQDGNGRLARFITDMFFHSHNHLLPPWPSLQLLPRDHQIRQQYMAALKKADEEDYAPLTVFIQGCFPTPSPA